MQTDIRGAVDPIGDILREIRSSEIFGKGEILLPQPNEQPLPDPSCQIIAIEIGLPRIYLSYAEASQIE